MSENTEQTCLYNAEGFFQFEIIINVLVSSFPFISSRNKYVMNIRLNYKCFALSARGSTLVFRSHSDQILKIEETHKYRHGKHPQKTQTCQLEKLIICNCRRQHKWLLTFLMATRLLQTSTPPENSAIRPSFVNTCLKSDSLGSLMNTDVCVGTW